MKWDREKAQDALRHLDAVILDGISTLISRLYRFSGLHPLFLLLAVTGANIAVSIAIVVSAGSESMEAMLLFLLAFTVFLLPLMRSAFGLAKTVRRDWTMTVYKPAMTYHLTARTFWNRRMGNLLRCLAVFSLLFAGNIHWPAPDFILYLAALCLLIPLEVYVRHAEPPVPTDGGLVNRNLQMSPS